MWLWRTTEGWKHVIYHIFNREICLDIIKEGIGQGGLADGTGHPKHYGYVYHGGKVLPWNTRH